MASPERHTSDTPVHLFSPDGRQTRIDFFSTIRSGKSAPHVVLPKKASAEWWHLLTGWLKSTPKEQEHQLDEFKRYLESKQYSKRTCSSYLFMLRKFFEYLDKTSAGDITIGIIEDYNYDFFVQGKYSRSYQLQFINGLSLYLEFAHGVRVNLKGLRKSSSKR